MTTISCSAASRYHSASSAPNRLQKSARLASLRQYATTRSICGSAARMLSTWLSACQPQPITPSVVAFGRARCRAATALAAPVRRWPSRSASMIASSSALSAAKSRTTNRVPSSKLA